MAGSGRASSEARHPGFKLWSPSTDTPEQRAKDERLLRAYRKKKAAGAGGGAAEGDTDVDMDMDVRVAQAEQREMVRNILAGKARGEDFAQLLGQQLGEGFTYVDGSGSSGRTGSGRAGSASSLLHRPVTKESARLLKLEMKAYKKVASLERQIDEMSDVPLSAALDAAHAHSMEPEIVRAVKGTDGTVTNRAWVPASNEEMQQRDRRRASPQREALEGRGVVPGVALRAEPESGHARLMESREGAILRSVRTMLLKMELRKRPAPSSAPKIDFNKVGLEIVDVRLTRDFSWMQVYWRLPRDMENVEVTYKPGAYTSDNQNRVRKYKKGKKINRNREFKTVVSPMKSVVASNLEGLAPQIRFQVGKDVPMKFIPQLHLIYSPEPVGASPEARFLSMAQHRRRLDRVKQAAVNVGLREHVDDEDIESDIKYDLDVGHQYQDDSYDGEQDNGSFAELDLNGIGLSDDDDDNDDDGDGDGDGDGDSDGDKTV